MPTLNFCENLIAQFQTHFAIWYHLVNLVRISVLFLPPTRSILRTVLCYKLEVIKEYTHTGDGKSLCKETDKEMDSILIYVVAQDFSVSTQRRN